MAEISKIDHLLYLVELHRLLLEACRYSARQTDACDKRLLFLLQEALKISTKKLAPPLHDAGFTNPECLGEPKFLLTIRNLIQHIHYGVGVEDDDDDDDDDNVEVLPRRASAQSRAKKPEPKPRPDPDERESWVVNLPTNLAKSIWPDEPPESWIAKAPHLVNFTDEEIERQREKKRKEERERMMEWERIHRLYGIKDKD